MTRMLDAWHDAYHADAPDYINCPYCQDELMDAQSMPLPTVDMTGEVERADWMEAQFDPDNSHIDRLEDLEV
ncbi:hypothetical protein ACFWPU_00980 [Streptomyces sp. NPDC058471]|uniref:hypothetical protein n=1 Tax=Streptomyces sp. NPDC058471 TaxID=3346516 RepID=UPI00364E9EF0